MLENTKINFYKNLQTIALDLVNSWGLKYTEEADNLGDPLLRWLDFRLRYIDSVPRKVIVSNKLPKKLPAEVESGLIELVDKLKHGIDVNPYQSKGLVRFNDTSGNQAQKRTDLLWADWGVTHLHITNLPIKNGSYFSERVCSNGESWLLFCLVLGSEVGLIDVRHHNDKDLFSDIDLLETVKQSWPDYLEQFRMKDVLPGSSQFSNFERGQLRKAGSSCLVTLGDKVYMGPGMGITMANTPLMVTQKEQNVLNWGDDLVRYVCDEGGPILHELKKLNIDKPVFELCITPEGFAIYEENSKIAFKLIRKDSDSERDYFDEMVDLFCPDWAIKQLLTTRR